MTVYIFWPKPYIERTKWTLKGWPFWSKPYFCRCESTPFLIKDIIHVVKAKVDSEIKTINFEGNSSKIFKTNV